MPRPPEPEDLRARGRWPPPPGRRVAIVGSRRPSPYGEAVAERLAADLAATGVIVVSGLALGVDGEAHAGALAAGGPTVAVLAGGADVPYPASHAHIYRGIAAGGGAAVSELPPG
ncbi:MAG TPA: DNA-processing protein DprA, partial [Acidimicrobiia bacterium]|nr:DNA-processing protein DprA [Acidimicrobiia bacterium]